MSDRPNAQPKKKRVNLRRPDVMEKVQAEVERHYRSSLVEKIHAQGGKLTVGHTSIHLAKQFGFCYGVERAIDLAYAARRVFHENHIYLIGEIIHNPEVNQQLVDMEIVSLPWKEMGKHYDSLTEEDVVIVPAFGAPTSFMNKLKEYGVQIVDTTCGDVMKVWRRVSSYAKDEITSIIHGKAEHEETRATASRALGKEGNGHYLIILTMEDARYLCEYLAGNGIRDDFFSRFKGAYSEGFDPDRHLKRLGVANQTTMLKSETLSIQNLLADAIIKRDGKADNFSVFDTICGATQERQDALFGMLKETMDVLLVVGGYNSSNTTHLVEIGEKQLPTFFIRNSKCLQDLETIVHFDLQEKKEVSSSPPLPFLADAPVVIGITAGASCPSNLIEETILQVFRLRGIDPSLVQIYTN